MLDPVTMSSLIPPLAGALGKGGGSTRTNVSQSTNVSLAVNPIIANTYGGGTTANTAGNASGNPYAGGGASGNDGEYIPQTTYGQTRYPTAPYGDQVLYGTPTVTGQQSGGDMMPLLLIGGAGLLLLTMMD